MIVLCPKETPFRCGYATSAVAHNKLFIVLEAGPRILGSECLTRSSWFTWLRQPISGQDTVVCPSEEHGDQGEDDPAFNFRLWLDRIP